MAISSSLLYTSVLHRSTFAYIIIFWYIRTIRERRWAMQLTVPLAPPIKWNDPDEMRTTAEQWLDDNLVHTGDTLLTPAERILKGLIYQRILDILDGIDDQHDPNTQELRYEAIGCALERISRYGGYSQSKAKDMLDALPITWNHFPFIGEALHPEAASQSA